MCSFAHRPNAAKSDGEFRGDRARWQGFEGEKTFHSFQDIELLASICRLFVTFWHQRRGNQNRGQDALFDTFCIPITIFLMKWWASSPVIGVCFQYFLGGCSPSFHSQNYILFLKKWGSSTPFYRFFVFLKGSCHFILDHRFIVQEKGMQSLQNIVIGTSSRSRSNNFPMANQTEQQTFPQDWEYYGVSSGDMFAISVCDCFFICSEVSRRVSGKVSVLDGFACVGQSGPLIL